ncbi:MAG TPA: DUF924 family protein [Pseudomonadales bacterium]|nr:DUF924 family protein [Pseudomonadales bacterium]
MPTNPADDIIEFWIGPAATDPEESSARARLWYQSTPESDEDLRHRFGDLLNQAEQGELEHWRETANGTLALVILMDQFSRNLYRGTAQAFSNDDHVAAVAEQAVDTGLDQQMSWIGRAFLYHPFEHSERIDRQERSVELFSKLVEDAPGDWKKHLEGFAEYAAEHRNVVKQFGRFPHRNAVLGRESTPEEIAYLDSGARRYGQ